MSQPHEHAKPHGRKLHKDWRTWLAVGLMLVAMLIYVLSLDESIAPPVPPAGNAPPPAPAPAQP